MVNKLNLGIFKLLDFTPTQLRAKWAENCTLVVELELCLNYIIY